MTTTLFSQAAGTLARLTQAIGWQEQLPAATTLLAHMMGSTSQRSLSDPPLWSCLTDDGSPCEFSLGLQPEGIDLRWLVEAQADPATVASYWQAGQQLNQRLAEKYGADLTRLQEIEDLYVPTDPSAYFAVWHGVDWRMNRPPLFKLYLNPAAQGIPSVRQTVQETMTRLGFGASWEALSQKLDPADQITHVSLDLAATSTARLKLYVRLRQPTLQRLEQLYGLGRTAVAGEVSGFVQALVGQCEGLTGRPVLMVFHYQDPNDQHPAQTVLNLPVVGYLPNDAVAAERLTRILEVCQLPVAAYQQAITVMTEQPLDQELGLHSYVSWKRQQGEPRVTIYLNPCIYRDRYGFQALDPLRTWDEEVHSEGPPAQVSIDRTARV